MDGRLWSSIVPGNMMPYLTNKPQNIIQEKSEPKHPGTEFDHIKTIIENRAIVPYFQPIVDLFSGEIFGYEVLTRTKGYEITPPDLFHQAGEAGLSWELEHVCRTEALKKIAKLPDPLACRNFFLNVSPHVFSTPDFHYGFTRKEIEQLDLDYRNIIIEITESSTVDDYTLFEEQIRHYVGEGFRVALDDFGAGHSGLITLVAMTPHFLKLDMGIINSIHLHSYKQKLLNAISTFASGVETSLIAEGIEKYEELKTVFRLGARFAQGFLFSRPKPEPPLLDEESKKLLHTLIEEYNHTRFAVDISISKLVTRPPTIELGTKTCGELDHDFRRNNSMDHLVVIDREKPVGLITRQGFYSATGGRYGYAFFERKHVEQLKLPEMLMVDEQMDLRSVGKLAMGREREQLYNPVVIIDKEGHLVGTITIKQLLSKVFDTEIKIASFANPLTQLPGNVIIGVWLEEFLVKPEFLVVYGDLNYFKEFNDTFGFAAGDEMIKLTTSIIQRHLTGQFPDSRFGHIGGDDFIIVSENTIPEETYESICRDFDREKLAYFTPEQQEKGHYRAVNRQGKEVDTPLVALSLAVITQDNFASAPHPGKLSEIAANLKRKIKLQNRGQPKSDYLIDRRLYGTPDEI
jgi:EAL domain-containing protein (putative c-di-GMP-specific phosphodiesterase class I)/GGDEF domain-containing protein